MITCPNCRQPLEDGASFCAMCGVAIPTELFTAAPAPMDVRKKCVNGHVWTDANLFYCPECGRELFEESVPAPKAWACPHCGKDNVGDDLFCAFCGKNRNMPVAPPKPAPVTSAPSGIPKGLRPAAPSDLVRHKS